ncbi:MAG: tRNA epoxyqueuosine(34) reductase QueG [Actinomycetota bacterium]
MTDAYTEELLALVRAAGADRVGVTTAAPLTRARVAIESRLATGQADDMQFTFRNPERSTTPTMSVPGARSIIVAARSYWSDGTPSEDAARHNDVTSTNAGVEARVARYAWRNHYEPLRDALREAAQRLKSDGHRATVFADDNSIVDREVAYRAGLGWYGRNANLLLEGLGSWFVLGCVVTTAELRVTEREVGDGCGSCRRCIDACPTGAIVEPGVVDARKCLAWLLQKPGIFDPAHRAALGTRIYGCDDCQEVCPPSRRGAIDRAVGDERASVDALELLTATDDEVLRIVGEWYVADRNPRWVRRNALLVLGNSGHRGDDVATVLARYVHGEDALLREHALWAAERLGFEHLVTEELVP